MGTNKLTMAQALMRYLNQQYVERDGKQNKFFAGCFGIFGHGNIAGVGQALQQTPGLTYYQTRNEQSMVHTAAAFAKSKNRMQTLICTSSVGPGATNMITPAAGATVNRVPVLLLPGDIFARRKVAPVLQQVESEFTQDIGVNDCFRPISRYWDRIYRPEQIITSLPEAMRVLTSPANTGAVTLSLPQDVQADAFDYPEEMFEKRVWTIQRPRPDDTIFKKAVEWIKSSKKPMIVAGGGVIYGEATEQLRAFVNQTGIPVGESQAGKGSMRYDHPQALGGLGVTGTKAANLVAHDADLIIGIGTRYADFTSASKTAFQNPDVRFVNINVAEFDAYKHAAMPVVADAKVTLEMLMQALGDYKVDTDYQDHCEQLHKEWDQEVERLYNLNHAPIPSQSEVIGAVNNFSDEKDVVLCAAGSLPADLQKLWRTRDPNGYHMEFGFSCMGYEVAGGLGVKMAHPDREVYVMVGDASYLMLAQEVITAVQEKLKLTIVLVNNHGYASIGGLSNAVGSSGFGTKYRYRGEDGQISGDKLPVDFVANASSMGAHTISASTIDEFKAALSEAKQQENTTVIVVETDREERVPGYDSWWDAAIAEVSEMDTVRAARAQYEEGRAKERYFLKAN